MKPKSHLSGLNEVQIALLRTFNRNIPDEELLEITSNLNPLISEQNLHTLMSKCKAVIDTNVLIKTIKRSNAELAIYEAFIAERFCWAVSTSVLNEYEEKLTEFYSPKTAQLIIEVLCTAPNVIFASRISSGISLKKTRTTTNFQT